VPREGVITDDIKLVKLIESDSVTVIVFSPSLSLTSLAIHHSAARMSRMMDGPLTRLLHTR
jgi:hypothetical protein